MSFAETLKQLRGKAGKSRYKLAQWSGLSEAYQDARTWALIFLNAYVGGNKGELETFQQLLSVEGGAEDVFVEIE